MQLFRVGHDPRQGRREVEDHPGGLGPVAGLQQIGHAGEDGGEGLLVQARATRSSVVQERPDDPGDPLRLLLDHVEVAPLRVLARDHALERLRSTRDHAEGRTDLVGDLRRQHPHRGQLLRLLDLALEAQPLLGLREQRLVRLLEVLRHAVEFVRQFLELVVALQADPPREIPAADGAGAVDERADGARYAPPGDGQDGQGEERQDRQPQHDAFAEGAGGLLLGLSEAVAQLQRAHSPAGPSEGSDVAQDTMVPVPDERGDRLAGAEGQVDDGIVRGRRVTGRDARRHDLPLGVEDRDPDEPGPRPDVIQELLELLRRPPPPHVLPDGEGQGLAEDALIGHGQAHEPLALAHQADVVVRARDGHQHQHQQDGESGREMLHAGRLAVMPGRSRPGRAPSGWPSSSPRCGRV